MGPINRNVRPFVPYVKGAIPPEFNVAPAISLTTRNKRSHILNPEKSVNIYKSWRDGSLKLNSTAFSKYAAEVKVYDYGPHYYYYLIDLNYLLSPLWRKENLQSPMGLFRWSVEMGAALRANAIQNYGNVGLDNSFLHSAFRMIKTLEGQSCGYRCINSPILGLGALYLYTLLHHLFLARLYRVSG